MFDKCALIMYCKCLLQGPLQLIDVHVTQSEVLGNGINPVSKGHADMDRKITQQ